MINRKTEIGLSFRKDVRSPRRRISAGPLPVGALRGAPGSFSGGLSRSNAAAADRPFPLPGSSADRSPTGIRRVDMKGSIRTFAKHSAAAVALLALMDGAALAAQISPNPNPAGTTITPATGTNDSNRSEEHTSELQSPVH